MTNSNQSISRLFRLLAHLSKGKQTTNLSQLERELGINRITLSRLFKSLEDEGVVEPLALGGYQLGLHFLALAADSLNAKDFNDYYQNSLDNLSQQFSLSAYYTVLEGNNVFYMARKTPSSPLISNIKPGARVPFFTVAPGIILWAHQPKDRQQQMLEQAKKEWPKHLEQIDRLNSQLNSLINDKVAWSFSGYEGGVNACAAAIQSNKKQCIAAISLAGPEQNFPNNDEFKQRVATQLILISQQLGLIYMQLN